MKVRDLLSRYPKLWTYDYKWKNAENYMDLNEILEIIGYKLVDADTIAGDYSDIKGYLECEIEEVS